MTHYVYILRSIRDDSLYIGMSSDLEKRLRDHNRGTSKYTKGHRPYKLVYTGKFKDRSSARQREKQLKSGAERELIKRFLPR